MEMTGLDPRRDQVLEIACIVTDGTLDHEIEGPETDAERPVWLSWWHVFSKIQFRTFARRLDWPWFFSLFLDRLPTSPLS